MEKTYTGRCLCGSTIGVIDDDLVIASVLVAFDSPNRKELKPTSRSYVSKKPKWWKIEIEN